MGGYKYQNISCNVCSLSEQNLCETGKEDKGIWLRGHTRTSMLKGGIL